MYQCWNNFLFLFEGFWWDENLEWHEEETGKWEILIRWNKHFSGSSRASFSRRGLGGCVQMREAAYVGLWAR